MGTGKEYDMNKYSEWFVRMSNGTVFGPINTQGISHWAEDGRIMPDDEVSTDQTNWIRACDLDELGMDTMLELPDGSFKGPYNPKAIDILANEGTIPMRAVRFHKQELEERKASRQISLFGDEAWEKGEDEADKEQNIALSEQLKQQLEQVRQEAHDAVELAEREADELRVEREQLLVEKGNLIKQLEALTEELASVNKDAPEVEEDTQATSSSLETECEELRVQAQLLAQQLSAVENERDTLAQRLEEQAIQHAESLNTQPMSVIDSEEYLTLLAEKDATETALIAAKELAEQATNSLEAAVKTHESDAKELAELHSQVDALKEQATELSSELSVAKENNALSKELLQLAEAAKKELTDALATELANVEEKTMQLATVEEKSSTLEQKVASLSTEVSELTKSKQELESELLQVKEEYSELLDFSNTRDTEHNEEISVLKQQLEERPEVVQTRREQMLEAQLKASMQEVDILRGQLENLSAQKMTEDNYTEDDISLIKRFADESINILRKTLEEEKEANLTARAKSIERQRMLHEELQRLERVMQRDPGELTRAEMSEQRANKQIAKLQQELESERRHHQADVARADANATALEQRYRMLMQKEAAVREQLSAAESRIADFDSVNNLLRRRETALLAAEKEFEEARQQWKLTEETLQHRIDELESGAGLLFDNRSINMGETTGTKSVTRSSLSRIVLER
jgi:chromosome segregation ATPase